MNYKPSDPCVCGHTKDMHNSNDLCLNCLFATGIYGNGENECDNFRLDNLKYVEEEAKNRKLI